MPVRKSPGFLNINPLAEMPDEREPTWGDYGRALVIGGERAVAGIGAATRAAGEELDAPRLARAGSAIQTWGTEAAEETAEAMSPTARRRMEAALNDPAFTEDVFSSIGLKLTSTTAPILASVIPATMFSGAVAATAAAAGTAALFNTSSMVDDLYKQIDTIADEELQNQSPVYRKLREKMNEPQARKQFASVARGMKPAYVAAASALTAGFGPAGQLARGMVGAPVAAVGRATATRRIASGAAEAAAAETIEEGAVAAATEYGRVATGEIARARPGQIALGAAEGALLGGAMGGGISVLARGSAKGRDQANAPAANPKPVTNSKTQATTAQPSTAPAVTPVPASPQSNIKTKATTSAGSVVTPNTALLAPRQKPPRAATGLAAPVTTSVVPTTDPSVQAPVAPEITASTGPDVAQTAALVAKAAPKADVVRQIAKRRAQAPAPPGTVATGLGPATQPVPVPPTEEVTPPGNDNTPAAASLAVGVREPATAEPVVSSPPQARTTGAALARAPAPTPAAVAGPRILSDLSPEVQAREQEFVAPAIARQRERLAANAAALARAEAKQQRNERIAEGVNVPVGQLRSDLYGEAGVKRNEDIKNATRLFQTHAGTNEFVTSREQFPQLRERLEGILNEAKEANVKIPQRIVYDAMVPPDNHMIWLREVADISKVLAKNPRSAEARKEQLERVQSFQLREQTAKKTGDFGQMKSERRAEGAKVKRGGQKDVETIATPATASASIEGEEGESVGVGVSEEAPSFASAEADAVPTVASKVKKSAPRGMQSEGDEVIVIGGKAEPRGRAASVVRGVSDEVRADIMRRLEQEQKDKAAKQVSTPQKGAPVQAPAPAKKSVPAKAAAVVEKSKARGKKLPQKVTEAAKKTQRNPTPAQIEAGNYEKGKVSVQGIEITIETPKGAMRRGTDSQGNPWEVKMPAHYGYVKSTRGADGEQIDVTLGPKPDSDFVLVIDQIDPRTRKFDEHKAFVGFNNVAAALETYVDSFSDKSGPNRLGEFTPMTIAEFKEWLKGPTKKAVGDLEVAQQAEVDQLEGHPDQVVVDEETGENIALPQDTDAIIVPEVELDDLDVRNFGPVIPYTGGLRSVDAMPAGVALDRYVTPDIVKGLPGKLYPFIKRKLIDALQYTDVQVYFVTDETFRRMRGLRGDTAAAFYDPITQNVIVRNSYRNGRSPQFLAHAVMHELAHAATVAKLDTEYATYGDDILTKAPDSATYQLTALMLDVQKQITQNQAAIAEISGIKEDALGNLYAFKNVREFVAEGLSNPRFQEILAKLDVSSDVAMFLKLGQHRKVSFWSGFVDKIRELLGMPNGTYSALEAVLSSSERLMYASRQYDMEDQYLSALGSLPRENVTPERLIARRNVNRAVAQAVAQRKPGLILPQENTGISAAAIVDNLEFNIRDFVDQRVAATNRAFGDPKLLRWRSMTDMAALAKSYFRGNSVRKVVNAIEAIRVTGGEMLRAAEPILNDIIAAQRKYKGTKWFDEMAAVMHDATMSGAHPDRPLADNPQLGKASMKGFWGRVQHADLSARYDALPEDLKAVYQKSMKFFQDQHNKMIRQNIENRVLKALGINDSDLAGRIFNGTTTEADKVTLGENYELVAEAAEFRKVTGPYFPLKRFGQFVVRGAYEVTEPATALRRIDDNTFEFGTQKEAEDYVRSSKLHTTLTSLYVDSATGNTFFVDTNGKHIRVLKEDTDAERRWRVRVQNRHVEFFENRREAEERRIELQQEGVSVEAVQPRRDDPRQAQGDMLSTHMETLLRRIEQRDNFKEMSEFQQNELRRAVEQASFAVLASTRIQTSRIQRRYVEGASRDILRSTSEYAQSMAGYLARYQHQGELDAAIKEMNKEADSPGDANTAMGRGLIRNEIMYRINQPNIAPSSHNTRMDQWRHRLLVTSFIGHLASPAYSLVNATQPIMVTTPIIGARHGLGATVAAMTKAYADISATKTVGAGLRGTIARAREATANTNTYVGDALDRLTNPRERAMIQHLIKHGAIDADAGMEISRIVNQTTGDQWLSYFEGISRQLPLAVETINRFSSALAAYRLEMKRTGDHEASMLYAQEIVESTQGIYAGTNVPPIFSSPIASIMFQFKKYGHLIYSLLGQHIGKAIRNEQPGDRAEAIRALGFIVGAHMVMAGTVGLPTEVIKVALTGANLFGLTGLTMDDFEEWERELAVSVFGDKLGEMVTHGVLRGLPGGLSVDLSQRLGMQSYLTFGEPRGAGAGLQENDIWAFVGETLGGAPGGMLMDMATGAREIANGDFTKGASKMVPVKIIKDGIKAYQETTEGKKSRSGRQTMEPLSYPEAALRLFGIQPGRAAETQLAQSSYYRNTGRQNAERSRFMDKWAQASTSERRKLWTKIKDWNEDRPPDARLTYAHLQRYLRQRGKEEKSGKVVGGMRVTPRDKEIMERIDRLYNQQ